MSANNNHNSNTFTQYTFIICFHFQCPVLLQQTFDSHRSQSFNENTMYRWLFEYVSISAGSVSFSTEHCWYWYVARVFRKSVYCFVSWTNKCLAGSLGRGYNCARWIESEKFVQMQVKIRYIKVNDTLRAAVGCVTTVLYNGDLDRIY